MKKTDKNFRMTKQSKILLSNVQNSHYRGTLKRMLIDSQLSLAAAIQSGTKDPLPLKKDKDKSAKLNDSSAAGAV